MLTPQQAQQLLKDHRVEDFQAQRLTAIAKLPDAPLLTKLTRFLRQDDHDLSLREIAYSLIGYQRDGQPFPPGQSSAQAYYKASLAALSELPTEDRIAVFATSFPKFAPAVELLWQFTPQLPYQIGYYRKAFRAPGHPDVYLTTRGQFLNELQILAQYHEDLLWFAEHAGYLGHINNALGFLFAAAIDSGNDALFDLLIASGRGEHPVGIVGRHVTRALLSASRPDGWEFVESLLLAAQREEGLRQTILEAVDEAHPQAFQRMLHVIRDHDLTRFSAVMRAANVWLGFGYDVETTRSLNGLFDRLLTLLEDADSRAEAIRSGSGESLYLALWSTAYSDVFAAIDAARPCLNDPDVERRYAATHLLVSFNLPATLPVLLPSLKDPDLRVAIRALDNLNQGNYPAEFGAFEAVEALLPRLPKDRLPLAPILWNWQIQIADREHVAGYLVRTRQERSPKLLLPYLDQMQSYTQVETAKLLAKLGLDDPEVRAVLIKLIGARENYVRSEMLKIFADQAVAPPEAAYLESLLTRKTNDLRRGVLTLLLKQSDEIALASADHLTAAKKPEQRLAGLELLQLLYNAKRSPRACAARAAVYREAHSELLEAERNLIESMTEGKQAAPTLDNALGLMNPAGRSKVTRPRDRKAKLTSETAVANLLSLDALIHEHRAEPIHIKTWQGENQERLLGDQNANFPHTDPKTPLAEELVRLPLRELWEAWAQQRQRDPDSFEVLRMVDELRVYQLTSNPYQRRNNPALKEPAYMLHYAVLINLLLYWLMRIFPAPDNADFLLDVVETLWAKIPPERLKGERNQWGGWNDWRSNYQDASVSWLDLTHFHRRLSEADWQPDHIRRLWGLLRWFEAPLPDSPPLRPEIEFALQAHTLGAATDDDLYDHLLGARSRFAHNSGQFDSLTLFSWRKPSPLFAQYPAVVPIFERCRDRVLEVELRRGEMPTAATEAAQALRSIPGTGWFIRLLQTLGKEALSRDRWGNGRGLSLSRLLRITYPLESDTAEAFAAQVKAARIAEQTLIDAAVFAPQWSAFIESTLGWPGFAEAVWWLHAHTKDTHWFINQELREQWNAELSERTPLESEALLHGAVDVSWFWRTYDTLGAARWEKVYQAAKYTSSGIGHGRAKLFASAMLGKVDQPMLVNRITTKRNQDALRALGLLTLPQDERDSVILERYQIVQEFLRTGRQFGAQRRESEKHAAAIALENLARTAGYADPQRLQWAMETEAVADLRSGSISATADDVMLTLRIDFMGQPQLEIARVGKTLKALPAKYKKTPAFVALRERKHEIDKQYSRMRWALESAMCRADTFSGKEMRALLQHPVLAPMLEQLVFISGKQVGYLAQGGKALQRYDGTTSAVKPKASLRIAHPYDLFVEGNWHEWQRDCFTSERIQPFKQVFRELYPLTETERSEGALSRRYAGHQVQPRQALALLGQRGWISHPDYGVQKTFHEEKLSAHLHFLGGYFTPAEVEGLTIEGVVFTKSGEWQAVQLANMPPILFSEAMRDLDLVVSVAHSGGVDPESTASTVVMRAALIRETCALLKVENVKLQGNFALVEGKLGSYSIHLGSAIVHRQPGGALCVVPVHAQQRGRIFLPFADDDPKTAEVLSKVLLFARDTQIKDPAILEQIYAGG